MWLRDTICGHSAIMEDCQDAINFIRDADEEEENNRRRPYVVRERTDPLTFYNDFEF